MSVNFEPRPEIELEILELNAGALLRVGAWAGAGRVFPLYVAAGLAVARTEFENLVWERESRDVAALSIGLGPRFGFEYALAGALSLRCEVSETLMWTGGRGLEEALAEGVAREEGRAAQVEIEKTPFSLFSVSADLRIQL